MATPLSAGAVANSPSSTTSPLASSISAGDGLIHVRVLPPSKLTLYQLNYKYPLKLISPAPTQWAKSLTVFVLSYGGGLVSGDAVNLRVEVEDRGKLCLQTQGTTKIFKQTPSSPPTVQRMTVRIHPGASFLLLPDPVQPFAESNYIQHQTFELEDTANDTSSLVVLDWVTEGRAARDEHWSLHRFESRNEVFAVSPNTINEETVVNGNSNNDNNTASGNGSDESRKQKKRGKLLLRDAMILDSRVLSPANDGETLRERQDGQTIFSTLIIRGKPFEELIAYIKARYANEPRIGQKRWDTDDDSRRHNRIEIEARNSGIMWAASSVRGFLLVKVSGVEMEGVKRFIRGLLGQVDGDGVAKEDGCIVREFGSGMFRCLE
ncbi:hypothetical protein H072_8944 [Dactylellina haptotyla CBS 200.50]|uniref:Urease accessory protein UreD n=1 Tax=Dactylellina haptotyla (strain CBS 200.50) TaxID=1284197 RepID=S8BDT4_DACHA|nr:hypothetical protein H072_8944 [Dactylellina haptotyla CBS 200.50]